MGKDLDMPEEPPISREDLLRVGRGVLVRAMRHVDNKYTRQSDRQSWARIVSSLITSLGSILNEWDLNELRRRVEKLEGEVKQNKQKG